MTDLSELRARTDALVQAVTDLAAVNDLVAATAKAADDLKAEVDALTQPPPPPPNPTRDPYVLPFAPESPWLRRLGPDAVYGTMPVVKSTVSRWDNVASDSEPYALVPPGEGEEVEVWTFDRTAPNDTKQYWANPLLSVAANAVKPAVKTGLKVRIPAGAFYDIADASWDQNTPNAAAAFLAVKGTSHPDGRVIADDETVVQFNYAFVMRGDSKRRLLAGAVRGLLSLRGDGVQFAQGKDAWGGHGGSMLGPAALSIRKGELFNDDPIPHAVALCGFMKGFGKNDGASPPKNVKTWPAFTYDSAQAYGSLTSLGFNAIVPMGGLIAIPPTVNVDTLGLETAAGRKLAQAIQDYGCYLVDECGSSTWVQNLWCLEWGVVEEGLANGVNLGGTNVASEFGSRYPGVAVFPNGWSRDTLRILQACRVVTNNAADGAAWASPDALPLAGAVAPPPPPPPPPGGRLTTAPPRDSVAYCAGFVRGSVLGDGSRGGSTWTIKCSGPSDVYADDWANEVARCATKAEINVTRNGRQFTIAHSVLGSTWDSLFPTSIATGVEVQGFLTGVLMGEGSGSATAAKALVYDATTTYVDDPNTPVNEAEQKPNLVAQAWRQAGADPTVEAVAGGTWRVYLTKAKDEDIIDALAASAVRKERIPWQ